MILVQCSDQLSNKATDIGSSFRQHQPRDEACEPAVAPYCKHVGRVANWAFNNIWACHRVCDNSTIPSSKNLPSRAKKLMPGGEGGGGAGRGGKVEFCRHYKTSPQASLEKRFIIICFYSFVQVFIFIPVNIFPAQVT